MSHPLQKHHGPPPGRCQGSFCRGDGGIVADNVGFHCKVPWQCWPWRCWHLSHLTVPKTNKRREAPETRLVRAITKKKKILFQSSCFQAELIVFRSVEVSTNKLGFGGRALDTAEVLISLAATKGFGYRKVSSWMCSFHGWKKVQKLDPQTGIGYKRYLTKR